MTSPTALRAAVERLETDHRGSEKYGAYGVVYRADLRLALDALEEARRLNVYYGRNGRAIKTPHSERHMLTPERVRDLALTTTVFSDDYCTADEFHELLAAWRELAAIKARSLPTIAAELAALPECACANPDRQPWTHHTDELRSDGTYITAICTCGGRFTFNVSAHQYPR